jgi:heat shock protein HtpX
LAVLLGAMVLTLGGCSWLLGGGLGVALVVAAVLAGAIGVSQFPASAIMDLHRAEPLEPDRHPGLALTVAGLAARAGLATPPQLYRLPGPGINALAAGRGARAAIALSDETMVAMSSRELRAVLAHEITHIAAGDTRLLVLTVLIGRLTRGAAQFALVACLMLVVATDTVMLSAWQVAALLVAVPVVSLLQFALARNQEYAADLGAIRLTDDPIGLVAALELVERLDLDEANAAQLYRRSGGISRLLESLVRSHPSPQHRISRLFDRLYRAPLAAPALVQPVVTPVQGRQVGTTGGRLRRSGGLTMPPDITTFNPSSTVMSSTTTSLRGMNSKKAAVGIGLVGITTVTKS